MPPPSPAELARLASDIRRWGVELGFQQVGISDVHLGVHEAHLLSWLERGFHGEMGYMARHGTRRSRPDELEPGTVRVISARMDYWPPGRDAVAVLRDPLLGYVSRYALGRDYHKLLRKRLAQLVARVTGAVGEFGARVYVDSAPVLEKALAEQAGLGWIGKHSNLIHPKAGSWFFLGEIYTDLPLPVDDAATGNHCGRCTACLDACPTGAIVAPYQVDARLCVSYLTIELHGPIPEPLRPLLGNRIYGCDDCQLVCPWNRFARLTGEGDFAPRNDLDAPALAALLRWEEPEFLQRTEGSPIRRIGHDRWLRNVAVALGNGPATPEAMAALETRLSHPAELVREHVRWALARLSTR